MSSKELPTFRTHLALFFLSAALIAFQLEQMQFLALVQWHHFAYLIISVALLGFGVAGMVIALFRTTLLENLNIILSLSMFCCSISMSAALPVAQRIVDAFDIGQLLVDPLQAGLLLAGQAIYLLIFFLGALPIGLLFVHHSGRIGSLYCVNLIGSGAGGILVVICMYFLTPRELPFLTALLPWSAGMLIVPRGRYVLQLAGGVTMIATFLSFLFSPELSPSQYKAISRALDLPEAKVVDSRPSPYGLVQLVTAPALRYAPGLSLAYSGRVEPLDAVVFSNGDWFGPILGGDVSYLKATLSSLPYVIGKPEEVLVLEAGTGGDAVQALNSGAGMVRMIEPHRAAVQAAEDRYDDAGIHLRDTQAASMHFLASRTWLATDKDRYDLIILRDVGTFGGASGFSALREQYLFTGESFRALWGHLQPDGIIRVSSWLDSPPRNSLRLAATIVETLEEAGVEAERHLAVISSWDMVTFMVKRSPWQDDEKRAIAEFCDRLQFDPVLLQGHAQDGNRTYNASADQDYIRYLDKLLLPAGRKDLYASYPFDIRPVSDNRPFFSQFLQWKSFPALIGLFGQHTAPFLEMGYVLVLISFLQMTVAAILLILVPLYRLRMRSQEKVRRWTLPYFSGLGLGYMFFEIVLIHEMILYLGNPIFASAAVISALLIFSGLGSLYSGREGPKMLNHWRAAFLAAMFLGVCLLFMPPLLHATIGLPVYGKILLFLSVIAPPAFIMGMPFPLGLEKLAGHSKSQAAWAWGINGSVSVVSTGLAAIVAVEFGFFTVMLAACLGYVLAAMAGYKG